MTRKDYVLIAEALKEARAQTDHDATGKQAADIITEEIAIRLAQENGRFDAMRFYIAAGHSHHV